MPTFDISGPDGKTYSIEGPDGATPTQAFQILQTHLGASAAPDKYQQAAQEENAKLKAAGVDTGSGIARQVAQGMSMGSGDEVLAGLSTPLEMVKHGTFDPREGYNYAKARENLIMEEARKKNGMLGTAAEISGGILTGGAAANTGLTLARPGMGFMGRLGAGAAEGAGYGALTGALEGGDTFSDRFSGAGKGAALGAGVGGAIPVAGAVAGGVLGPIASNIRARINPEGVAQSQLGRALMESGKTAPAVDTAIQQAAQEGQGGFRVADALGNSGQRMLSTVTRAPGAGRQQAVDFLNARQAGQGERVSGALDEALGASGSARKTADELTQTARTESAPYYEAALAKKPVWNERIQQFFDDPVTKGGLKEGVAVQRLESLAQGKKFDPNDYAITGFDKAGDPIMSGVPNMRTINLIKKGWDNQLEQYRDSTTGKLMLDEKGRALDSVRRSFLKEVDAVNPDYAKARALYAGPAQARDAVAMGGKSATRGRAEDNLRQFGGMTEPNKQGYRIGYADKLSDRIERGAEGVNAVRPLTSEKAKKELLALSLHQGPLQPGQVDPLTRRLGRESTMFETRRQATGGSQTHDNANDALAQHVDPSIMVSLLSGHPGHAAMHMLRSVGNGLNGYTPAVREQMARLLLGSDVSPAVQQVAQSMERRGHIARRLLNATYAGTGIESQRK